MVELDQLWMCLWAGCDYKYVQGKLSITWNLSVKGRLYRNFVRNFGDLNEKTIMLHLPFMWKLNG
jgi:hypothetical protein